MITGELAVYAFLFRLESMSDRQGTRAHRYNSMLYNSTFYPGGR